MKKSTIPALCFFAVIVLVAHWTRPLTFTVRVQTPGVPPLDLATTDFLQEFNRQGLQRTPKEENFAAGLAELIVVPDWDGDPAYPRKPNEQSVSNATQVAAKSHPGRKATLAAYEIEDTKKAQQFWFGDFVTSKYRFPLTASPFGNRQGPYFAMDSSDEVLSKPWTRQRFPVVSEWLDAKHGLLENIERISHRQHFFQFAFRGEGIGIGYEFSLVTAVRRLQNLYTAQVNRALGEGNLAEAKKGIFTLLRIASLLIDADSETEFFVGSIINELACRLAVQWLSHPALASLSLNEFGTQLDSTPRLAPPVRLADVANRFLMFEQLQRHYRHGVSDLHGASGSEKRGLGERLFLNALLCGLADWNDISRRSAQEADELVKTLRLEDPKTRRTRVRKLKGSRQRIGSLRDPAWQLARGQFGSLSGHYFWSTTTAFERASMNRQVVKFCVALKRHQLEHGNFPDRPVVALRKESETLPTDVWTNLPMRYLKTGNGVVLYSVGQSQTDNGGWNGQGRDDEVWVLGVDDRQDPRNPSSERDAVIARLKHMGVHFRQHDPSGKGPHIIFDGTVTDEQISRFIEMKQEWAPLSSFGVTAGEVPDEVTGTGWSLWFLGSQITDASLDRLSPLNGILGLLFFDTGITDAGLSRIKDFKGLTMLYLGQPNVTDAGLENLKEVTQFWVLNARGTMGTEAGVADLQKSLPNCKIIK